MGSFTRLTYHIVFATKYRNPTISTEWKDRLYEYIGGIVRERKGQLIQVGGTADHIHLLARLSASIAVANVVRDLKAISSKWMNERPKVNQIFEWQIGYGAFTVSYSQRDVVKTYIQNQEEHHRRKTFQEEYIEILKRHDIDFQLEHLFEREHHG
jgi:REP element-mobilizing transposase RayT